MPNIRSEGIFADERSGGGLFRGFFDASSTAGGASAKRTGAPIEMVSQRFIAFWMHDFIDSNDIGQYVVTNITSGTAVTAASSPNGYMTLDATTANQGLGSVQFDDNAVDNAAAFILAAANRVIIYECSVSISDIDDCDWFVGIGEVDTTFMSAAGALLANGADNCCGFHHVLAYSGVPYMTNCGTALANIDTTALGSGVDYAGHTLSSPTIADSTKIRFGFRIEETDRVEFYVNGQLTGVQTSTAAFDTAMTPTFCMIANGSAVTMLVDYVMIAQTRST